ncbi:hypothetical protein QTG56_22585 (plasmid) [Rossellomorea sp. AcN35-11]|nr:hypothetical protein [Rossellomorea aquimaris]WJV32161.1 hypothetical protein QTG56_22585 [Rossellomorea sp. AcN35-11]
MLFQKNKVKDNGISISIFITLSLICIIPFLYSALNSYKSLKAIEVEFGEEFTILKNEGNRILILGFDDGSAEEAYWFSVSENHEIIDKNQLTNKDLDKLMNYIKLGELNKWSESR